MFIFPNTFPLLANKSLLCVFYFIQNEKKAKNFHYIHSVTYLRQKFYKALQSTDGCAVFTQSR